MKLMFWLGARVCKVSNLVLESGNNGLVGNTILSAVLDIFKSLIKPRKLYVIDSET
jgi:hypothetical protein